MANYELMVLLAPSADSAIDDLPKTISGYISSLGGDIIESTSLGKKELAYPIKKLNLAHYHLFICSLLPNTISELDKKIRLDERVIRHIIVKFEKQEKSKTDKKPKGEDEVKENTKKAAKSKSKKTKTKKESPTKKVIKKSKK